ncbi:hypothetical protein [Streptomyces sp. KL116D]|uniref:hypothetical protein n=1 Tax=Streptomyces sp. KL116D TaxID=3045152 RepID=UPI003556D3E8
MAERAADALIAAMRSGKWSARDQDRFVEYFASTGDPDGSLVVELAELAGAVRTGDAALGLHRAAWAARFREALLRWPGSEQRLGDLTDEYAEPDEPVIDFSPPAWYLGETAQGPRARETERPADRPDGRDPEWYAARDALFRAADSRDREWYTAPDAREVADRAAAALRDAAGPPPFPLRSPRSGRPDGQDVPRPTAPHLPTAPADAPAPPAPTTTNTVTGGTQQALVQAGSVGAIHQHFGAAHDGPDWRPVHHIGPAEFGVRPTRRVSGLPDVPPYVPRDCDAELAANLTQYGLVLLLGKPVTGTSYAAWHAAHHLDGHQLYAPERGADLRALLGSLKGKPGRYLLWLDDIEGHLGERGLEPGLLGRLTALGVRILATMDADAYYERRTGSTPGDRVIAHAHTVELPRTWSESEFARLAEQVEDPRAYEAHLWTGGGNPAAYLALGHLLHEEWIRLSARNADPDGVALVRAALDVARCGYAGPVPLELLRKLGAPGDTGWAARERIGNVGFLMPGERPGTWRAHGALVAGTLRTAGEPATDELRWQVFDAAAHRGPEEAAVGDALAAVLRPRAEAGEADAAHGMGQLARLAGDPQQERRWFRQAADAGHEEAVEDLAVLLVADGEFTAAVPYLETLAAAGRTWAALELADHHRARAEELLTGAVEASVPSGRAALHLGDLISGTPGRAEESMSHYIAAWDAGVGDAALRIAGLLHDWGRPQEAEPWYRCAADAGDTLAAYYLGVFLFNAGDRTPEVHTLLTRAAEAGHAAAETALGLLAEERGARREAFTHYEKGDEGGHPEAAYRIALMADDPAVRDDWLHRAAEQGHYDANRTTGTIAPDPPDTVDG